MLLCRDWKLLDSYQNSSCNPSFDLKRGHDPIFTCVTAEVSCDAAVAACCKLLQGSLTWKYTVRKICHEFQFSIYFGLYETLKNTLSTLQRIITGRIANYSHHIKPSVIYHTGKSTILYLYKVLFTVIANSSNYSDSSAGVQFTLKLIVRK